MKIGKMKSNILIICIFLLLINTGFTNTIVMSETDNPDKSGTNSFQFIKQEKMIIDNNTFYNSGKYAGISKSDPDIQVSNDHLTFQYEEGLKRENNALGPDININIDDTKIMVNISFSPINITDDGTYQWISAQGCDDIIQAGKPRLPVKHFLILPPYNSTVESIKLSTDEKVLMGKYNLKSNPKPSLYNNQIYSDNETFDSLDIYPEKAFTINGYHRFRGYQLLSVSCFPSRYEPNSHTLTQIQNCNVCINLQPSKQDFTMYRGLTKDNQAIKHIIANPKTADSYPIDEGNIATTYEYVIITSSSLEDEFEPLETWKDSKLGSANTVTISYIEDNYR